MQIGGIGGAGSAFGNALRIRSVGEAAAFAPSGAGKLSLRDFATSVSDLGEALRDLRLAGRFREGGGRGREARAISAESLGLGGTPTPAALRSVDEVNATPTSYDTSGAVWSGASTAAPSLAGVYDGSNGDTTLTFTVTSGGELDVDPIELTVTDAGGATVDTLSIGSGQGSLTQTLSNGLELSLASGTLDTGDTFAIDVFASVGAAVDIDAAFDGGGGAGPNFEAGVAVTAGAFFVNSQRITVAASDTIRDVLDRISSSAAGVDATWDAAAEKVVLTQQTPGSLGQIEIVGDSSGFTAAVKLADAELEFGSSNDSELVLDGVTELAAIQTGEFTINGETFQVDTGEDSLASLIRWVNASDAGVMANYDAVTGKFSVRALGQKSLVLDDGTSGFFSALGIEEGVYRGEASTRKVSFDDERGLRRELADLGKSLAQVFEGEVGGYASGAAKVIREALVSELEGTFDSLLDKEGAERLRSGLGLDLGERSDGRRELLVDTAQLGRALRRDEDELADLLFSEEKGDGQSGLVERLEGALERAFRQLEGMLAPEEAIGLRLDVAA